VLTIEGIKQVKLLIAIVAGVAAVAALAVVWIVPVTLSSEPGEVRHLIPDDLSATLVSDGAAVELTWSRVEADDVTLVVQRSVDGSQDSWINLAELAPGSTKYIDRDFHSDDTVVYRLYTFDDEGGSGISAVATVEV
jgi:hypothetical protein